MCSFLQEHEMDTQQVDCIHLYVWCLISETTYSTVLYEGHNIKDISNFKFLQSHKEQMPWSRVLLKKFSCTNSQNFLPSVEAKHSLSCSQEPALNRMNPVDTPPLNFLNIQINITLPPILRSSKWSFSFRLSNWNLVCTSFHPHVYYKQCLPHPPQFDSCNIWWREQIMKLLVIQFSSIISSASYFQIPSEVTKNTSG